jgi:CheY-like chemotaxis protein
VGSATVAHADADIHTFRLEGGFAFAVVGGCPNDAETRNGCEDEDGCPDVAPLPAPPPRTETEIQLDQLGERIQSPPESSEGPREQPPGNALGDCAPVETVGTFEAGVESVRSYPPDVVLLDVSLRRPDCAQVVEMLRGSRRGQQIVIAVMTRGGAPRQCHYAAGADECFVDPVDADDLARCLEHCAVLRRGLVAPPV